MMANLDQEVYEIADQDALADIVIINSCTVTNAADANVRSYINQIRSKNIHVKIYMTGCGVSVQGQKLLNEKNLSGVFGHSHKENINTLLNLKKPFYKPGNLRHLDESIVSDFVGKTKAFYKNSRRLQFQLFLLYYS